MVLMLMRLPSWAQRSEQLKSSRYIPIIITQDYACFDTATIIRLRADVAELRYLRIANSQADSLISSLTSQAEALRLSVGSADSAYTTCLIAHNAIAKHRDLLTEALQESTLHNIVKTKHIKKLQRQRIGIGLLTLVGWVLVFL